jgi:hypothetical protein
MRIGARRTAVAAVVILAVAAVGGVVLGLHERSLAAREYGARIRTVAADVLALERGAQSDASALERAFDDSETRAALGEQAAVWQDRVRRCATVRGKLRALVSKNTEQAARQMDLDLRMSALEAMSDEMALAAATRDAVSARRIAGALARIDED